MPALAYFLLAIPPAHAFVPYPDCQPPFYMVFPWSDEYQWGGTAPDQTIQDQVHLGASAWTGGENTAQEGYAFSFTLETNPTFPGLIQLYWVTEPADYTAECGTKKYACTRPQVSSWNPSSVVRMHTWFDASADWNSDPTAFPVDNGQPSVSWVAADEFGHALGLEHDDSPVGLMDSNKVHAGDANKNFRVHGDEYGAMYTWVQDYDPDDNVEPGFKHNFVLYGFGPELHPIENGTTEERWRDQESVGLDSQVSCCTCLGPWPNFCPEQNSIPEEIWVYAQGDSPPSTVDVGFYLVQNSDPPQCTTGTRVATQTVALTANEASPVLIDWTEPQNGFPWSGDGGTHRLCAAVDPDQLVNESSEDDNYFTSEADYIFVWCPWPQECP